ncbi:hypothetical protein P7C70_g9205, partial [Phenoliferia sp. Uapishka_3]
MLTLSASAAAEIDAAIRDAVADPHRGLPRAVVMATSKEGLLYSGSGGFAQLPEFGAPASAFESAERISTTSVFELWSMTKLVSVVAALQMVEQGKLDLQADASLYVPALKNVKILESFDGEKPVLVDKKTVVTVEMLITHTAGFGYDHNIPIQAKYRKLNGLPANAGIDADTASITKIPLAKEPGSVWIYGTSNDWLALCVEAVSGQGIDEYFQEHIFDLLGMNDFSFKSDGKNKINMAYIPSNPEDPYIVGPGVTWNFKRGFGGHGLVGSPESYLKLVRALLCGGEVDGKRILAGDTVQQMFLPHLNDAQQAGCDPFTRKRDLAEYEANGPGPQWGLGGALTQVDLPSGRRAGSLNWSGMAATYWVIDPTTEVAFGVPLASCKYRLDEADMFLYLLVIFTNVMPGATGSPQQIWDLFEKVEVALYRGLSVE